MKNATLRIIEILLGIGFVNLMLEFLGFFDKYVFFLILSGFYCGYRVVDYFHRNGNRTFVYVIAVIYLLASVAFFAASITRFIAFEVFRRGGTDRFLYRVEAMQEKQSRVYTSSILPNSWYGTMRHILGRAWYPMLLDYNHRYDSINISLIQLNHSGMYSWDYFCQLYQCCYGPDDSLWYFLCQGENPKSESLPYRNAVILPSGISCPTSTKEIVRSKDSYTAIGITTLPDSCTSFTRLFCSIETMKDTLEGFLLDFQYLVHPPFQINLRLLTNQVISEAKLNRLEKRSNYSIFDWIVAAPRYSIDSVMQFTRLAEDSVGVSVHESLLAIIDNCQLSETDSSFHLEQAINCPIYTYEGRYFLTGGPNLYVVSYKVEKN